MLRIVLPAILVLGILIGVCSLVIEALIPRFVNLDELKARVETTMQHSTGIRADIQSVSIHPTLFEGVKVTFHQSAFYDPDDVKLVDADKVNLYVRILPLINGKASVSKVILEEVEGFIGRNSYLFRIKLPQQSSQEVALEDARIGLKNYHIFVDRALDENNRYVLDGKHLALSHVKSHKPIRLDGVGEGYYGPYNPTERIGRFEIRAKCNPRLVQGKKPHWKDIYQLKLKLETLELPAATTLLQTNHIPVWGSGQVRSLETEYKRGKDRMRIVLKGRTSQETRISLGDTRLWFVPGSLYLSSHLQHDAAWTHLDLNDLIFQMTGSHINIITKGDLKLKVRPFQLAWADLDLSTNWLPLKTLEVAPLLSPPHEHLIGSLAGDFKTRMHMVGNLEKPHLTGKLDLRNVTVQALGSDKSLAHNIKGTFHVKNSRYLKVKDFSGLLSDSPFYLYGDADLKAQTLRGMISATNIKAGELQKLLMQFMPSGSSPLSKLVFEGEAGINLSAWGSIHHPNLMGDIALNRVSLSSRQKNTSILTNLSGNLVFEDQLIRLPHLSGNIGSSPMHLYGRYHRKAQTWNLRLTGSNVELHQVQQSISQLARAFSQMPAWLTRYRVQGTTHLDVTLGGSAKHPTLTGTTTLSNFSLKDQAHQLTLWTPGTQFQFVGRSLKVHPFKAQLESIPFTVSGGLDDGFGRTNIKLSTAGADLNAIHKVLQSFEPTISQQLTMRGPVNAELLLTGPVQHPLVTGTISPQGVDLSYIPKPVTLQNLSGTVELLAREFRLVGLNGVIEEVPLTFDGVVSRDASTYHIAVKGHDISLNRLQSAVSALLPEAATHLADLGLQEGHADIDLILSPDFPQGVGGQVTARNVLAAPPGLQMPIEITAVHYNLETGDLQFPQEGIRLGSLPLTVQGQASAQGYNLALVAHQVPLTFIRDNQPWIEQLLHIRLPEIYNAQGNITLEALLSSSRHEARIKFHNAGASISTLKYPIYNINGSVTMALAQGLKAYTDNLSLRYGNSPATLSFDIDGLKDMYLEMTGTVAPLLINDWLLANNSKTVASAAIPFDINLTGSLGQPTSTGSGNDLHMFFNFNVASLFSNPDLENPSRPGDSSLNDATLSSVLHLFGDTLNVEQTRFRVGNNSSVLLEGQVKHLFDSRLRQVALSLITEPRLDLSALSKQVNQQVTQGLAGEIVASLKLLMTGETLDTQGHVTFNHVRSTGWNLDDLNGSILFNGIQALLRIDRFRFPGVDVEFTGTIPDLRRYPVAITDFNVVGQEFIVPMYVEWIQETIVTKIRQGFWEQFFPSTGSVGSLPFEIQSGTLDIAEGIIDNLIVEDFKSLLRVYPNGYFELANTQARSAGGTVKGDFAMNPRDNNVMVVRLDIDKMKANAVSRILLNVANEIFGDLSGTIDYVTEGRTPQEFLANTNGFAKLRIEDGRLPSVAKIENLLVAANTISGGLANLNLNSLFRLAQPFNTNYFAKLTGSFKIIEGIVFTDDMFSDGQNLDMLFQGSVRMVDGYADLVVRGNMDRDIGGVLGPLGQFSVGRFLGIFPPLRAVLGHIPGVGFIPGFGGPRGDKGVAFEVKILGPSLDPGSVKDFRWVQ